MCSHELIEKLKQLPNNQRTKFAHNAIRQITSLGHDIEYIVALLPILERAEFTKNNLDKIETPYVFSLALARLPKEYRLEFATQHYSFFTLKRRRESAALACILRLLPEENRVDFALNYSDEINEASDWLLKSVVEALPPTSRFIFIMPFLATVFIHADSTITLLDLLEEKDRLQFYLSSKGTYLAFDSLKYALTLIPPTDIEQFLEINTQKMLMTLVMSDAICHHIFDVRHPTYYSLQRAFNAIAYDQKDEQQKARTYAQHYAINSTPYNPQLDDEYLYLRELEAKAVSSLVQQKEEPLFSSSTVDLITQYSAHYIDPQQCRERTLELERLPQDDLSWRDLVYLHNNTLGLRGVTDDDMAINEAKYGGHGDAISLANFGMGEQKELDFSILVDEKIMDEQYPQQKAALLKSLQDGMKWHINISFKYGYSIAFELISKGYDALSPYDFGTTYRLGKCGSAKINAAQIKKVILRSDCSTWNAESIYRFVVAAIKELRLAQEPAQSSTVEQQTCAEVAEPHAETIKKPAQRYNPKLFTSVTTLLSIEPVEEAPKSLFSSCTIL